MKLEKWTLGLAAAGLVTLSPGLLAQTSTAPQLVPLQTALSATTISGYVDTSAVWNPGTGNANPAPFAFNYGKQDGFNLDAVDVKIAKALDESSWSAGYVAELSYGPDAMAIDGGAYPIRQAYVTMRTPIGNGLDWQLGRWDNLIGYESSDAMNNPNFTRSYGYTFEPTEHTGLLASYKFCDVVSAKAGVADTVTTVGLNQRTDGSGAVIESKKAFVSLLTLTAPDSFGAFKGSALYAGWDYGQGGANAKYGGGFNLEVPAKPHDKSEIYVGATINTPVTGLTFGASWDAIFHNDVVVPGSDIGAIGTGAVDTGYFQAFAGYASFKATDKLTISGRAEYADGWGLAAVADANNTTSIGTLPATAVPNPLDKVLALTGTVQYQLWDNVISRVEIRWDHAAGGANAFGSNTEDTPNKKNDVMIAANVIYKF